MRIKALIIMAVQFIVVVAAGFAFYLFTQKEIEPTKAYVFVHDMNVNEEITGADVKEVTIPKKAISAGFALNPKEIVGKFASGSILEGQYVYKDNLLGEEEVDVFLDMDLSKLRKISLPISYLDGFGGNIKRGDAVDLVYTGSSKARNEEGSEKDFQYSKVFLQDVLVYNVTTSNGFPFKDHTDIVFGELEDDTQITGNMDELSVVTIAVTLNQAEEIQARMASGNIRLAGRFDEHESYETLGFVMGEYDKVFTAPANAETGRTTIN